MNHLLKENRLKQDEVDAACVAIMQRGERISTNTVHKEVGERGSFSTIQKMIKDWQTRNPEQSEQVNHLPVVVDIPEALKTAGNNALKAFWQQAREIAQNELKTQQEALKRAEDEVNLKMTELQEFSDNQADTIEALREQLAQVTTSHIALENLLTTERGNNAVFSEKLQQSLHELELSRLENANLTSQLADTKTQHDKDLIELKTILAQRDADSKQFRTESEAKLKTSEERAKSLDIQVTKLQTVLDIQARQIDETKAERAQALAAEKAALEKAAALSGQLELVMAENKKLQVKTSTKPRQAAKLENKP